ncbi:MAG: STAS domain-containing protein [Phycisphaerales bacterium JB039]
MRSTDHGSDLPERAGAMRPMHRLATYDHLGATLVVTITVNTLSGPDAVQLVHDIADQMPHDAPPPRRRRRDEPDDQTVVLRHIVLDLQNVQYMDSGCIGVLVELMTKLQHGGGRIALVNADPNVEYLFKLTRLDRLFPICRDVMRAIESVERAA